MLAFPLLCANSLKIAKYALLTYFCRQFSRKVTKSPL
jgi:hypothetical protein